MFAKQFGSVYFHFSQLKVNKSSKRFRIIIATHIVRTSCQKSITSYESGRHETQAGLNCGYTLVFEVE